MSRLARLLALAAVASLALAGPSAAASKRYLTDCVKAVQRPATLTLTCADANSGLTKLRWTGWGAASAQATGSYAYNTCVPDCAAGKQASVPVKVTASGSKACKGRSHYAKVTLTFTGKVPPGERRTGSQTLPCPLR